MRLSTTAVALVVAFAAFPTAVAAQWNEPGLVGVGPFRVQVDPPAGGANDSLCLGMPPGVIAESWRSGLARYGVPTYPEGEGAEGAPVILLKPWCRGDAWALDLVVRATALHVQTQEPFPAIVWHQALVGTFSQQGVSGIIRGQGFLMQTFGSAYEAMNPGESGAP